MKRKILLWAVCAALLAALILLLVQVHLLRQEVAGLRETGDAACRVPVRFLMDEPECANRLLDALEIKDVRVKSLQDLNVSPAD